MAAKRTDDDKLAEEAQSAATTIEADGDADAEEPEEAQPLQLEVDVTSPSACERHVTVTISRRISSAISMMRSAR